MLVKRGDKDRIARFCLVKSTVELAGSAIKTGRLHGKEFPIAIKGRAYLCRSTWIWQTDPCP